MIEMVEEDACFFGQGGWKGEPIQITGFTMK